MTSRRQVSARRQKLTKQKVREIIASRPAKDSPVEINREMAENIKRELYESTIEGFQEELDKSSPAVKALASKFSGLINEFFEGYKEGIEQEMESQLNTMGVFETLKDSPEDSTEEHLKNISETLESINENLTGDNKPSIPSGDVPKRLSPEQIREAREKSSSILSRGREFNAPRQSFAGKAMQYAISATAGAYGLGEYADKKLEEYKRKESFIQTEMQLRSKSDAKFASLSSSEQRKILKSDYKNIEKSTKDLKKLESEVSVLESQGYSKEQIEDKLGYAEKRQSLLSTIEKADSSRIKGISEDIPKEKKQKAESDEKQTKLLIDQQSSKESQNETAVLLEQSGDRVEEQTKLLSEIRDLIKKGSEKKPDQEEPQDSGFSAGDLLNGRGLLKGAKSLGGKVKSLGGKALTFAKGFAIPAAVAGVAGMAADTGLGALGVGKDEAGNEIKIDEKQDEANWEKMSLSQKLESGAARGIEKIGSFIGLTNLAKESEASRIKKETEFLSKKSPQVIDQTTLNSEPIDNFKTQAVESSPRTRVHSESASGNVKIDDRSISSASPMDPSDFTSTQLERNLSNLSEPVEINKSEMVKKPIDKSLSLPDVSVAKELASTISKSIVVQAPQPIVLPSPGDNKGNQIMQQPFTNSIKFKEPTMAEYLRSRYSPA